MRARAAAARLVESSERAGIRVLLSSDTDYPARLHDLPDPSPLLFALGDVATLRAPVVAIVGTRGATAYGTRVTSEIAASLARAGACVLSGLARGIDAAAHHAALDVGGRTAAVLGTGVDIPYPAAHRTLHGRIAQGGLLLSEQHPGDRATGGSFPMRNRLIAALADLTIIVEAPFRSGALITARHALDLGRTVAAVPGPIDVPQSAGSNELLRDGAVVIAAVADALALVGLTAPVPRVGTESFGADECAVWEALSAGAVDLDTLATRSRLPAERCLAAVSTLELAGAVECGLTGEVRRR